jgi:hypothetical protein
MKPAKLSVRMCQAYFFQHFSHGCSRKGGLNIITFVVMVTTGMLIGRTATLLTVRRGFSFTFIIGTAHITIDKVTRTTAVGATTEKGAHPYLITYLMPVG